MIKHCFIGLFLLGLSGSAQDVYRFEEEVNNIAKKYDTLWDSSRETIVFTGSSSIRLWDNLENLFSEYQIVNSGFGGSEASDLLHFTDELILQYNPKKVFIYEGDNDINSDKKPKEIIQDIREIIRKVKLQDDSTEIVLIAAKPSLARWHLKKHYKRLNKKFKRLSKKDYQLFFANVWDVMLEDKKLKEEIFIEDGLHLNTKGYELWYAVIAHYVN